MPQKVLVIAEGGINHGGDLTMAIKMIEAAAQCKADIFKTQWYDPDKLLGVDSPYYNEAKKAQLTFKDHEELSRLSKDMGIEYCISIFDKTKIPSCEDLGMKRYKIASRVASDLDFLEEIAKTKKPVIISTGMSDLKGIQDAIVTFGPGYPLTLLYCVCSYPTKLDDIHLNILDTLSDYATSVGFSSHCPLIGPTLAAVAKGAVVTENHVTFDKNQIGCDISSSIDFEEFNSMVKLIRQMEKVC